MSNPSSVRNCSSAFPTRSLDMLGPNQDAGDTNEPGPTASSNPGCGLLGTAFFAPEWCSSSLPRWRQHGALVGNACHVRSTQQGVAYHNIWVEDPQEFMQVCMDWSTAEPILLHGDGFHRLKQSMWLAFGTCGRPLSLSPAPALCEPIACYPPCLTIIIHDLASELNKFHYEAVILTSIEH